MAELSLTFSLTGGTVAEVFSITPASSKPLWVLAAIGILLVALLLLFASFVYSARATRFELSPGGLSIRGTLYGRTIPWSRLALPDARVVNLRDSVAYQPGLRTNGVGLPGYQAGWFRLRDHGEGLVFLTDRGEVVALPTLDGYTLLLSVRDAGRFLESARRMSVMKE